jgi:NADH-quinone oxidoreductase subunit H
MSDSIVTLIGRAMFGARPLEGAALAAAVAVSCALVLFVIAVPFASIVTWVERRVWARIQSRVGPNRVGPNGVLQWLADGIKHVCKEDVIPDEADARLFKFAPYLVVLAFILPWAVMPFSSVLILADLNIGILYMTAITALTVVGVLMAGWSSNNKWSLIGGIRSAAQIISYEIPAGLSIFPAVLITGTLSMQGLIRAQAWEPYHWFIFANPFCFAAAIILFVSTLAENNRTPFDLPEAESELVAGFATEYSSMRYLFFFMAEWGNMFIAAAIIVTLYLGGWQVPRFDFSPALMNLLQFIAFLIKVLVLVFASMWIRGTLPRVRIDQMMSICWKYFVPIGFINMVGTAIWVAFFPHGSRAMEMVMFALAVAIVAAFGWRVAYFTRRARMELYLHPTI